MRPTWRTVGVVGVAVGSILMASASGARALNALAAPALIALLVSVLQVYRAGRPEIDREDPAPGHPGESRTVALTVDGGALARVTDAVPPGVAAEGYDRRVTLPATVEYEIELGARGAWDLGPPRVVVTDVLGLFVRSFEPEGSATALVYPPLVDLREDDAVARLLSRETATDRQAFDTIREYAPRADRAIYDVTGRIADPIAAMREHAPDRERVSLHPLFAPANEPGNVPVVADASGPVTDAVREALAARGNDLFETTAEEHDRAMETVQARTHAAVLSFALAADPVADQFHTPISAGLAALADQVTGGDPRVYADIQAAFDGAEDVAEAARAIADADGEDFEHLFEEAGDDR